MCTALDRSRYRSAHPACCGNVEVHRAGAGIAVLSPDRESSRRLQSAYISAVRGRLPYYISGGRPAVATLSHKPRGATGAYALQKVPTCNRSSEVRWSAGMCTTGRVPLAGAAAAPHPGRSLGIEGKTWAHYGSRYHFGPRLTGRNQTLPNRQRHIAGDLPPD
jgi:hypothetical protein